MCRYVIFAGVNGAGKTTLYQSNIKIQNMPRVNLDEIVRVFGKWDNIKDVTKAGEIAIKKIREYFANKISFNQETTLCGNSIVKNIITAKKLGYSIEIYYVGLNSADLAVERVKERVVKGGHGVPETDIKRRYFNSLIQLKKVLGYCDKVELFDNSGVFRRIAIYENNKWNLLVSDIPVWCGDIIK